MVKKRSLLIWLILVILASRSTAITWNEVLTRAADKSHDIKSSQKQLDAYQWSCYKSYSSFLPQISARASGGNSTNSTGTSTSYSYGLSVSQSLFNGLSNYYNWRTAALTLDYYKATLQNTLSTVYYQARQAFLILYLAQKNLEVRRKIRQSRVDNVKMIKLLYDSGREDRGNYLRTEAQLAEAEHDLSSAQRQLDLARLKLSQLIETEVVTAEGVFQVGPVVLADIEPLVLSSPTYLLAKNQLEQADISQQASLSGFLPTLSLSASYAKTGSDWPPSASNKSLSLTASLPIFTGGSNFADRAIAGLQLEKAKEDFAKKHNDYYYTIKSAYDNLQNAIEAFEVQQGYLRASSERSKISQQKYLNGLTTYDEWDRIQNEYISNQTALLNSQQSLLLAEAGWCNSYGGYVK